MSKRYCITCERLLSKRSESGFCNTHRDRSGINNPFYGKRHTAETISNIKVKTAAKSKALWQNLDYRIRVTAAVSKPRVASFKKEQSERIKEWYINNPEQREIRKRHMTDSWSQGKITKNGYSSNHSKAELDFYKDIQSIVGDLSRKTIKIDNKWFFPDVLVAWRRVIIEYYGDYWHANPNTYKSTDIINGITAQEIWDRDSDRIDALEKQEYTVRVVWQSDYKKNRDAILTSLDHLINWEGCLI